MARWIEPPRTLLVVLFLFASVSICALAWFGWKVLEQDRLVESQRSQERLEQAADRLTVLVRGTLADAGDRLAAGSAAIADSLLLTLTDRSLTTQPPILYYPTESTDPEASPDIFAEAEQIEFTQSDPVRAVPLYAQLAESPDPAIRAGALLRLARSLRNSGLDAAPAYRKLAAIEGVRVAGAPASLVAARELGIDTLRHDLEQGRWHLTRGQFDFYWPASDPPSAEAVALADVASLVWEHRRDDPSARGQQTLWIANRPFFLLWRGTLERRTVLVANPAAFVSPAGDDIRWALIDASGRTLAGTRSEAGRAAVRTAAASQLPWTLYLTSSTSVRVASNQGFLLWGLAIMILFLAAGTYFIARAILREAQTQRMQSDFVAAVSHEFRSPLTSLRQLSEMLVSGRVPSEDRRQLYYETLERETNRLQRLVEGLLNFGRMEAGARQYRFERIDAASLVDRVMGDFHSQRHRITVEGDSGPCCFDADPEAVGVALRNLVDNALKYSPDYAPVSIEWRAHASTASIRVRDHGPGIADSERKAIFQRFVRGSAAALTNVKGSGVGLAMVRHIVAAHGGEITLETEVGKGSTFTMSFPISHGSMSESTPAAIAPPVRVGLRPHLVSAWGSDPAASPDAAPATTSDVKPHPSGLGFRKRQETP